MSLYKLGTSWIRSLVLAILDQFLNTDLSVGYSFLSERNSKHLRWFVFKNLQSGKRSTRKCEHFHQVHLIEDEKITVMVQIYQSWTLLAVHWNKKPISEWTYGKFEVDRCSSHKYFGKINNFIVKRLTNCNWLGIALIINNTLSKLNFAHQSPQSGLI